MIEQNDQLKLLNIQYQGCMRLLGSKSRKLAAENEQLKKENKELAEKLKFLSSRPNRPPEPTGDSKRAPTNGEPVNAFEGKVEDGKIEHLTKTVERFKGMYQSWKTACQEAEAKVRELEASYLKLQREKVNSLEKDPRIKEKISSEKEKKIKELTKRNNELQDLLHGNNEATSLDLTCVKLEKPAPESETQATSDAQATPEAQATSDAQATPEAQVTIDTTDEPTTTDKQVPMDTTDEQVQMDTQI